MKLMKFVDAFTNNVKKVSIDLTANNSYDWNSNLIEDGIVKHALVFGGIDSKVKIDLSELFLNDVSLFDITNKYDMRAKWGTFCDMAKSDDSLINGLESFLSKFGFDCNNVSIELGYDVLCSMVSFGELSLIEYYAWKSSLPKDKSTDREIRKAHNLEKMYVNGVFC